MWAAASTTASTPVLRSGRASLFSDRHAGISQRPASRGQGSAAIAPATSSAVSPCSGGLTGFRRLIRTRHIENDLDVFFLLLGAPQSIKALSVKFDRVCWIKNIIRFVST